MGELKPCPFCDMGKSKGLKCYDVETIFDPPYDENHPGAKCEFCGANAFKEDWNRRPMPDCVRETLEEFGMHSADCAYMMSECDCGCTCNGNKVVTAVREYFGEEPSHANPTQPPNPLPQEEWERRCLKAEAKVESLSTSRDKLAEAAEDFLSKASLGPSTVAYQESQDRLYDLLAEVDRE